MVWQAFFDESFDDDLFVIAGYLAKREQWAKFSIEWQQMLPLATLGKADQWAFKMSEMAKTLERMDRVPGFFRIIRDNVGLGIASWMRISDFNSVKNRIEVLTSAGAVRAISGPLIDNPYLVLLYHMLSVFGRTTDKSIVFKDYILRNGDKIDLIFDERGEKNLIIEGWDYAQKNPNIAKRFSSVPRFESDDAFLPLQAADFYAWWIRKWTLEGRNRIDRKQYPWGTSESAVPSFNIGVDENMLLGSLVEMAIHALDRGDLIVDRLSNRIIYQK